MGIGGSIKKGFSTATGSMGLVGVLFLFGAFWNLLNIFFTRRFQTPDATGSAIVIGAGIVFILLSVFMQAGSLGFVKDKLKNGSANLGSFGAAGGKYFGRLFVIGLVIALLIGVFVVLAALAVSALGEANQSAALAIAIVLGLIGIFVVILFFLAPYIAVVDEKGAIQSLKESAGLVKKNLLSVLGIALALIVVGFVIGLLLGLLFALINTGLAGQETIAQAIFAVLSSFVNAYLGVLVSASFMSFYMGLTNR